MIADTSMNDAPWWQRLQRLDTRTVMTDPELADVSIAILSGLPADELAARGGVPAGVVFFPKPINYDELRGYLRANVAQRVRKPAPV